jgi:hypothetical protein
MGNRKKPKAPWLRKLGGRTPVEEQGIASFVSAPPDEKEVIKEVPAKVDGITVGVAQIYDDGTIGVIIDDNAPQWAKDKIGDLSDQAGYSIGTDEL